MVKGTLAELLDKLTSDQSAIINQNISASVLFLKYSSKNGLKDLTKKTKALQKRIIELESEATGLKKKNILNTIKDIQQKINIFPLPDTEKSYLNLIYLDTKKSFFDFTEFLNGKSSTLSTNNFKDILNFIDNIRMVLKNPEKCFIENCKINYEVLTKNSNSDTRNNFSASKAEEILSELWKNLKLDLRTVQNYQGSLYDELKLQDYLENSFKNLKKSQ